jgi:hypothetical protein
MHFVLARWAMRTVPGPSVMSTMTSVMTTMTTFEVGRKSRMTADEHSPFISPRALKDLLSIPGYIEDLLNISRQNFSDTQIFALAYDAQNERDFIKLQDSAREPYKRHFCGLQRLMHHNELAMNAHQNNPASDQPDLVNLRLKFVKCTPPEEATVPVFFTLCYIGGGPDDDEIIYAFFHRGLQRVALVTAPTTDPRLVLLAEMFVAGYSTPLSCERMCAWCGQIALGDELKKCLGCKDVRYCNKQCQGKHWKMHRRVCRPTDT